MNVFTLIYDGPGGKPTRVNVREGDTMIGRGPTCTVVLGVPSSTIHVGTRRVVAHRVGAAQLACTTRSGTARG